LKDGAWRIPWNSLMVPSTVLDNSDCIIKKQAGVGQLAIVHLIRIFGQLELKSDGTSMCLTAPSIWATYVQYGYISRMLFKGMFLHLSSAQPAP
jgi:hypothetical protein